MNRGSILDMDKGIFSKVSRSTVEPACPPVQWVLGALSSIVKGSGH